MTGPRPAMIAVVAVVAVACASPREHFYTLRDGASSGLPDPASKADYTLIVASVTVPADVDRPELVVLDPPHGMRVLEQERWIEPLPAGIRRALADDLAQRLPNARVFEQGESVASGKTVQLHFYTRRLDLTPGKSVRLDADWVLQLATGGMRTGSTSVGIPLHTEGYPALVAAEAEAIARAADSIVATLEGARSTREEAGST